MSQLGLLALPRMTPLSGTSKSRPCSGPVWTVTRAISPLLHWGQSHRGGSSILPDSTALFLPARARSQVVLQSPRVRARFVRPPGVHFVPEVPRTRHPRGSLQSLRPRPPRRRGSRLALWVLPRRHGPRRGKLGPQSNQRPERASRSGVVEFYKSALATRWRTRAGLRRPESALHSK